MRKNFLLECDRFKRLEQDHPDGGTRERVVKGDYYGIVMKGFMILVTIVFAIVTYLIFESVFIIRITLVLFSFWTAQKVATTDPRIILYWWAYFLSKKIYSRVDGIRTGKSKQLPAERHYYAEKYIEELFCQETSIIH